MNPDLQRLQPYPFERLRSLFQGVQPPTDLKAISLGIGEPRHATPSQVVDALTGAVDGLSRYPATKGQPALRQAIANWAQRRFSLPTGSLDPDEQLLPVSGTREALFAIAQTVVDRSGKPLVGMPNPFYQIYEGAALLAGAEPLFLNCAADTDYLPDPDTISAADWDRCQLLYLCSPGNPSGAVMPPALQHRFIELAQKHDFVIAADECYSELYPPGATPPRGFLQTALETGLSDFRRLLVFHSLSKRSNAPGLRSGFVAGDAELIRAFLLYRTYHGCALPEQTQTASIAAWEDEQHVVDNREAYQQKFDAVLGILEGCLEVRRPVAGFYLWPRTPLDDTEFARRLYAEHHVTVLPGSYLSRQTDVGNPGAGHVRMALVASLDDCVEAARRIKLFCRSL
ncbi:N-succinyldiaminopimelate aminotransferase [Natronocella acetinitrilica]|uniref:N-succinyldiaminopimelate aminotransferase n=1 Tax=Natronocella acetinitrilica TaxID=414046 RepID=A0AAE3KDD3_9GAMM|nr:succinyldiaminopimelate transaminase [Natronocella acetinitrilica]MCP1676143.1 N-succinyldiaminopimelate aminotransferase [Natronocella acetinitrilica]